MIRAKRSVAAVVVSALAALVSSGPLGAQQASTQDTPAVVATSAVTLTNYGVSSSNPYFGSERRSWMETSMQVGLTLVSRGLTIDVAGLGVRTSGRDPYGTGTAPVAPPEVSVNVERASLSLARIGGSPLTATLGRQRIEIGSQFLIGDGVYDGFAPGSEQGVYHNPRKSFDALRVQGDIAGTRIDALGYLVSPTWDAAGGTDGRVFGLDVSRRVVRLGMSGGVGVYYRASRSDLDNDMAVINVRLDHAVPLLRGLRASGELAAEVGRCRNAVYCTAVGERMNERAWHAELRYEDTLRRRKPTVEVGAVHYSEDFTPLATGFSDWGRWYLGNQIDWINFGTNTNVLRAEVGFWPLAAVRVRSQYHSTRQVVPTGTSTGGTLSDEASLIAEWYPNARLWVNLALGYAMPGRALAESGLANPFAGMNPGAAPVGRRRATDVVLAIGLTF